MCSVEPQQDYVLRTVEERGVRLIRLWFTDVLGQLKSFAISPAELEGAFAEGMHFDGSAIDGFSRVQESDVLARPDPNTFELVTSFYTRYGYVEFVNSATSLGNSADYLGLVGINAATLSFL